MMTSELSCDPEGCDVGGRFAAADMLCIPLLENWGPPMQLPRGTAKWGELGRIGLGGKSLNL